MAWVRQLPSGLWAATVRTPTGRITETHRLKTPVENWAADREAEVRAGDWIDPRDGETTVGEWWERCRDARHLELASRRRDASIWANHVEPRWGHVPIGGILKPDVSGWVVDIQRAHGPDCPGRRCHGCRVGAWTIQAAVKVLRMLLEQAVDARKIRINPAVGIRQPRPPAHVDRILTPEEETDLLANFDAKFPGRPDARLFVETLLDTGLRWEEAAAAPRDLVDLRRGRIQVAYVMERDGSIRPYAKSEAGNRTVSVSDGLLPRLRGHVMTVPAGADPVRDPRCLVFTAPLGKPLWYSTWLPRVWKAGLVEDVPVPAQPRPAGRPGPAPRAVRQVPILDDPQPTPHDMRHTFGTRCADEGLPLHDLMALMGHKDLRSVQRYLHSGEERFERARQALERARQPRQARSADARS